MLFQVMVSTGDAQVSIVFFFNENRLSESFCVEMDYVFCVSSIRWVFEVSFVFRSNALKTRWFFFV